MKAIQMTSFGEPADVLTVVDLPEPPEPQAGEVLVSVEYSPLNFHDLYLIAGSFGPRPFPLVPGNEGMGRVVSTGPGVTGVRPGDRVVVPLLHGAWRERLVLPAAGLFALPEADPQQLAMLASNPPTASLILSEYVPLERGDWVIQDAANGGVGRSLIVLAHERGLRTVNLIRHPGHAEELRAAGADLVVVAGPDAADRIRGHLGDAPVRLAVDSVGGDTASILVDVLAPGGTLVHYGDATGRGVDDPLVTDKRITVTGFFAGGFDNETKVVPVVREAARLVAQGRLRVPVAGVYGLEDIQAAVAHLRRGGKILLRVGQTA